MQQQTPGAVLFLNPPTASEAAHWDLSHRRRERPHCAGPHWQRAQWEPAQAVASRSAQSRSGGPCTPRSGSPRTAPHCGGSLRIGNDPSGRLPRRTPEAVGARALAGVALRALSLATPPLRALALGGPPLRSVPVEALAVGPCAKAGCPTCKPSQWDVARPCDDAQWHVFRCERATSHDLVRECPPPAAPVGRFPQKVRRCPPPWDPSRCDASQKCSYLVGGCNGSLRTGHAPATGSSEMSKNTPKDPKGPQTTPKRPPRPQKT
jgi:hypothetical protein